MTKIAALGAGRMGRGIAQVFASAGEPVALIDFKLRPGADANALLEAGKQEIAANLRFLHDLGVLGGVEPAAILGRIDLVRAGDAGDALADAELIFEAVPELPAPKADALKRASALAPEAAILASTTSTILVDSLAEHVTLPSRFLNAHWLNPAYLIPLVEVSPGAATAARITERLLDILRRVGKVPVLCKASPGYIVPRIQSVAMNEAARMVEEGVATAEDIDMAIRTGFGIRYATMGLVEFIDWGGVDILFHASNYLTEALKSERFASPAIVGEMMARGDKGLDAGKGFYDYSGTNREDFRVEKLATFVALLKHLDLLPTISGSADP